MRGFDENQTTPSAEPSKLTWRKNRKGDEPAKHASSG